MVKLLSGRNVYQTETYPDDILLNHQFAAVAKTPVVRSKPRRLAAAGRQCRPGREAAAVGRL
jgi:hypothetical protein